MQKSKLFGGFLMLLFLFVSCDENSIIDKYVSLDNNIFKASEPIEFTFSVKDTVATNKVYIQLRNNNHFQYSNLFLITELQTPNGFIKVDTLEYEMADPRGNFLGKGMSGMVENILCYTQKCMPTTFENKGEYLFKIRHAMRESGKAKGIENLEGITDIGLRIEKNSKND